MIPAALPVHPETSLISGGDEFSPLEPGYLADLEDVQAIGGGFASLVSSPIWSNATGSSSRLGPESQADSGAAGTLPIGASSSPMPAETDAVFIAAETFVAEQGGSPRGPESWLPAQSRPAPADPDQPSLNWAALVDVAMRGDWDALDAELDQFLARLAGLYSEPETTTEPASVGIWLTVATAAMVARRVSRCVGPRLRGARDEAVDPRRSVEDPPVGPWPLGAP